MTETLLVTNFA